MWEWVRKPSRNVAQAERERELQGVSLPIFLNFLAPPCLVLITCRFGFWSYSISLFSFPLNKSRSSSLPFLDLFLCTFDKSPGRKYMNSPLEVFVCVFRLSYLTLAYPIAKVCTGLSSPRHLPLSLYLEQATIWLIISFLLFSLSTSSLELLCFTHLVGMASVYLYFIPDSFRQCGVHYSPWIIINFFSIIQLLIIFDL